MAKALRMVTVGAVPIVFGVGFAMLASTFSYPEILRQPTGLVLDRFTRDQAQILPWWWLMFVAALLFVPVSGLVPRWAGLTKEALHVAQGVGLISAVVQALGLSRWVFAVPVLARQAQDSSQRATALQVFEVIHQWFGVGIGEWAGYLFTALWSVLIAYGLYPRARWLAISGFVISAGIAFGLAEVFGLPVAGPVNAVAYSLWVLWMLGVAIFLGLRTPSTEFSTDIS